MTQTGPSAADMRAAFDAREPLTIGLEEELLLLDPDTLELAPVARELLERLGGDARFMLELPAAQLEIATRPAATVPEAAAQLGAARRDLAAAASGLALPAAAAAHPFSPAEGELIDRPRYRQTVEQYGTIAHRQIVGALHVHVAVGGADRTLAVYNALRSHLPELAALASAAPFYLGEDSGLASVRPKISDQLTRQGVPPEIDTWDAFAAALAWGEASGLMSEHAGWWWELRPHPTWGTLELRVPDVQATTADAAAVAAVAHALVAWLSERHDRGERLASRPRWRIQENRWLACKDGVEGTLADLETGERRPTRERLTDLLGELEPHAGRLGCVAELARARELTAVNGAMQQRAAAAGGGGPRAVAEWLAARFEDGL